MLQKTTPKWSKVKLGEIAVVLPGFAFKSSDFKKDSGISVIKIKSITDELTVQVENGEYLPENILNEKTRKYLVKKDDILVAMTGATAGKVGKFRLNKPALLNQRVAKISPKEIVDSGFLWCLLGNNETINTFYRLADGAAQPNMSGGQIESVEFTIPDLPTQKKIADVLSAYDDLIENNNRRIKILEETAQKIYTEWFVAFKFPGHEKVKMVDSGTEFGLTPEGWETKSLGSELELAYGKALKEENRIPGDVLVCGSGGVVGTHNQKLVSGPGVVVGRKGNAGAVFWVHKDFYPIDTAFFVKTKLPIEFVLYLLKSQNFILGDAAVPGLNREQAYRNPMLLPTSSLIKDFADRAKPLRVLADKLGDENLNLKKLRDLLIPQLVSGKLEVK